MTPLSQACTNGSAAFVRLLLKSGANPNTAIATGETPLMTCAKTGSVDAVRMLIEYGAAVNAKEPAQNQTALMWAAAERHPDVVRRSSTRMPISKPIPSRDSPRCTSRRGSGDLESVKLLLAAGVDVNILTQTDEAGDQPRHELSSGLPRPRATPATLRCWSRPCEARWTLALYLLDHGADPNIDAAGFTPLHWASTTWEGFAANPVYGFEDPMSGIPDRQAKLRLVKALLAHGANVNARMTKRAAVVRHRIHGRRRSDAFPAGRLGRRRGDDAHSARRRRRSQNRHGDECDSHHGGDGPEPWHRRESLVTEAQAMEAVKLLLDLGLDPKGETTFGENALFGPAYRGWNTLLAQLIDLGVNVNAVSKAGVTPYLAANGQGDRLGGVLYNKEGADLLLKHGADPKFGHPCEAQNKCRAE